MQLDFDADDHDGFTSVRNDLLDRFYEWLQTSAGLRAEKANAIALDGSLALDWKFSDADGNLARWTLPDLGEFLLDWCPRKVSVDPENARSIPGSIVRLVAFLDDAGLLAAGSARPAAVADAMASVEDEFVAAMGDSSRFGIAKSFFAGAKERGVDVSDEDAMGEWVESFNSLPLEERQGIIPDTMLSGPEVRLPAVAMPSDDDVRQSKAAAPILAMFTSLAGYIGDGRKLTQKGHLTLADAKDLVELLGTGDPVDVEIGDRTFKTRSSDELPGLRLVFAWAKKAGVLRQSHGRVIATKAGRALHENPAEAYDRTVASLFELGVVSAQRVPGSWIAWPDVDALLDEHAVAMLAMLYGAQEPFPLQVLAETVAGIVLGEFEFGRLPEGSVRRRIGNDVTDMVDALELAGLVCRSEIDAAEDLAIASRRTGGLVALTAAGMSTARDLVIEAGADAPVAGRFADGSALDLLRGTDTVDFESMSAEFEVWQRRRGPDDVAAELAAAIRKLDDQGLRNVAFALMGRDVDSSAPHVRALSDEPETRGFARCWLVDHGLAAPTDLFDDDDLVSFVDVLAIRVVMRGPDAIAETLALAGDSEKQIAVLEGIWRLPSPATAKVLDAIGSLHADKRIAKAARKALFKRRSALGPGR